MTKKVSDLNQKRRDERRRGRWSDSEIKAALIRERKAYKSKGLSENDQDDLVSGDCVKNT